MRCRNCGERPSRSGCRTSVRPASGRSRSQYDYAVVGRDADPRGDRGPRARDLALRRAPARSMRRRRAACRSARRRCSPPIGWRPSLGLDRLLDQGRHPQPVAVASRTGRWPWPPRARSSSGSRRWPAPRPATWPARRPRRRPRSGCPAYVFIPADLEPAKVDHALAYGATVVPDRGHLRRRQPALPRGRRRDRLGLRQHQPAAVLRRGVQDARVRDRRVARLALARRRRRAGRLGRDVHARRARVRGARRARPHRAPADPVRRRPGGRLRAGRDGLGGRHATSSSRSATPDTIVRSLAIGNPADGRYVVELVERERAARSRPSRTRRPPPRSATSPGSRASTRRRPAA